VKLLAALAIVLLQGCTYTNVEIGGDVIVTCPLPPPPLWNAPFMGPPETASRRLFREGFYAAAL